MGVDNTPAARVAELLAADSAALAAVVVEALAAAGAESEWDSETIERVLGPFHPLLDGLGVPWVGDASDEDAYRFWCDVAGVEPEVEP